MLQFSFKTPVVLYFLFMVFSWTDSTGQTLIHEDEFVNREFRNMKFGEGRYWFTGKTFGDRERAALRLFDEGTRQQIMEIESGRPSGNHHGGPARYYHSFGNAVFDTATRRFFVYRSSQEWENHYNVLLAFDTNGNELSDRKYSLTPAFVRDDTLFAYHHRFKRYYFLQASNLNFELEFHLETDKRFTTLRGYNFLTDGERLYTRNGTMYNFETEDFLDLNNGYENRDVIRTLSDTTFMYLAQKTRYDSTSERREVTKMVMRIFDIEMNKLYEAESDYSPGTFYTLSNLHVAPDSGFWALDNDGGHLVRFDRALNLKNRLFFDSGYHYKTHCVRNGELHLLTYKPHQTNYRVYADEYYAVKEDTISNTGNLSQNTAVNLFPNPTTGVLRMHGIAVGSRVEVFNLTGALVKQTRLQNGGFLSLDELPSGVYIISVRTEQADEKFRVIKK